MDSELKKWRLGAELSAADAAKKAGVTLAMWSRWETGAREVPANRVLKIEALTGVSRHTLRPDVFGDREVEPTGGEAA